MPCVKLKTNLANIAVATIDDDAAGRAAGVRRRVPRAREVRVVHVGGTSACTGH